MNVKRSMNVSERVNRLFSDMSKGPIAFADISISYTTIKTEIQIFIPKFLFERSVTFNQIYYGSVTNKCLRNAVLVCRCPIGSCSSGQLS